MRAEVHAIASMLARLSGVPRAGVLGRRRLKSFVIPRQVCCWLSRELLDLSLPHVGLLMGGLDHTTVLHACRVVAAEVKAEDGWRYRLAVAAVLELHRRGEQIDASDVDRYLFDRLLKLQDGDNPIAQGSDR